MKLVKQKCSVSSVPGLVKSFYGHVILHQAEPIPPDLVKIQKKKKNLTMPYFNDSLIV